MSTIEGLEAVAVIVCDVGNRKNNPRDWTNYLRMSLTTYLDLLRMNGYTFY